MRIYNTLSKTIEEFVPNEGNKVKMYTCGPTVYHYAHIGNLRTYIFEDILEKGLRYLGYDVTRAMNITDVGHLTSDGDTGEDKMQKGAKREGKTVYEIADFYTKAFLDDMRSLNIKVPEIIEKASDNIDIYIKMITKMLDDDYAYISNGNVYFDISKAKDYYKLSGKNPDDLKIGVRDTVEEDKSKRNPADFVLWFTLSKFENQVMKWDSPWGVGYPGWHIECSGISIKYLGEYLDIHCGAEDAIFPHHTNEIAQSESYLGHKWCNNWIHLSWLLTNGIKMSKSKGHVLTISKLKEEGYNPLAFRYFILGTYYHKQVDFTYEALKQASSAYSKLLNKIKQVKEDGVLQNEIFNTYDNEFKKALSNDLGTSNTLTLLYNLLKDSNVNGKTKLELIKSWDQVFSLNLLKEETIDKNLESYILSKIKERNEAKINKNYELADQIRQELLEKNIELIDTREGTTYKIQK
jgi:cysteinyl-tRNA synthetase